LTTGSFYDSLVKNNFHRRIEQRNCYLALTFSFLAGPIQIGALVVSARGEMDPCYLSRFKCPISDECTYHR
jgi:hypothetical protein